MIESKESPIEAEHPERALLMLKHIAIGSALIHGRLEVQDEDIRVIAHIASSSGPWERQKVFRALLLNEGSATTTRLTELTGLSKPTVIKHAKTVAGLALVRYAEGESAEGEPDRVELLDEYRELLPLFSGGDGLSVDSVAPVKPNGEREGNQRSMRP